MNRSIFSFILIPINLTTGAIELPSFFSDGMVLQQQSQAKIWGWLDEGGEISVHFAGQTEQSQTDEQGRWEVSFEGLQATNEGSDLLITDGTSEKVIQNVVVGEVWIASGQSNMELAVAKSNNAEEEITASDDPLLRVYVSKNISHAEPQIDLAGEWEIASPESTGGMTAVGYYYAKKLRQELSIPVGILECSWGGKPIEGFTSEEALNKVPELSPILDRKKTALETWTEEKAATNFVEATAKWERRGKKGRKPVLEPDPLFNPQLHTNIFNGMIAPIAGYSARGVIWYQGENNANNGTEHLYEELLGCMITDWRERWQSDLSFYYVQLANFRKVITEPGAESPWVVVQDEMRRALESIDKSGMAVTNDIGETSDIHPRNKQDVATRLARWALAQDYGKEGVVKSGPLYRKAQKEDNRFIITFDYAEGLKSRDGGSLQRFEIQSEDGTWAWAQTQIDGDQVIVWSDEIQNPKLVRYAWASNPQGANLVNGEGLPASCFTTER